MDKLCVHYPEDKHIFVNISAKAKIFLKIFWPVDLGPIWDYRFMKKKNQSSKISFYSPFNAVISWEISGPFLQYGGFCAGLALPRGLTHESAPQPEVPGLVRNGSASSGKNGSVDCGATRDSMNAEKTKFSNRACQIWWPEVSDLVTGSIRSGDQKCPLKKEGRKEVFIPEYLQTEEKPNYGMCMYRTFMPS